MLRRQERGDRDRPLPGDAENGTGYWYVDGFGYALLGFTAASAATAGLGMILVAHPAGKSWCVRMLNCPRHRTGGTVSTMDLDRLQPTNYVR